MLALYSLHNNSANSDK